MPSAQRASGLRVDVSDTYHITEPSAPTSAPSSGPRRADIRTTSPIPIPRPTPSRSGQDDQDRSETEALLRALELQHLSVVDRVQLDPAIEPTPEDGRRRAAAPIVPAMQQATFDLPVQANEQAALLVEQDGVYSWTLPERKTATPPGPPEAAGIRRETPSERWVHFTVPIRESRDVPAARTTRGLVSDFVYDRVVVYVIKFAADLVVGEGVKLIERNVRTGLVRIAGFDPARWAPANASQLMLPADRPARILLFVHGTFSSTIGSYGALAGTPWGQAFLAAATVHYDALLGFDHPTLGEDPLANANALLTALESLGLVNPQIDVIAFSRGGLVYRALVEHLLPRSTFRSRMTRAIFVGCTNEGTLLAEPENWRVLVDLYTNLAVAAFRLLRLMPHAAPAATVLSELVKGVGTFVVSLATSAATDVPGLAAMRPTGDFVRTLNTRQEGQPEARVVSYFAVTSSFTASLRGDGHEPRELPKRLLLALTDGLVDNVMHQGNDLVVNTSSMMAIEETVGAFVQDTFAFGETSLVYHTIYFTRPEVVNALTRWLQLSSPAVVPTSAPVRGIERPPRPLPPLPVPREIVLPAIVDTDIVAMDSLMPVIDAARVLRNTSPSYVVVSDAPRESDPTTYHALPIEEVMPRLEEYKTARLLDALQLRERPPATLQSIAAVREALERQSFSRPVEGQCTVVMLDDIPAGVIPPSDLITHDIVSFAWDTEAAATAGIADAPIARGLRRRAMPTFAGEARSPALPRLRRGPSRGVSSDGASETSVTRGGTATDSVTPFEAEAGPTEQPAARVACHLLAEMDREIVLHRAATIEVICSRDELAAFVERAHAGTTSTIDPSLKLTVQVIPKTNIALVDPANDRIEIDPPGRQPVAVDFDVKGTNVGKAEVWIVVRQRQFGVARLVLETTVVARNTAVRARRAIAEATAVEAPSLAEPVDQLLIVEQMQGDTCQYWFELDLPSVNVLESHTSPPLKVKREEYVKQLYKGVEERYISFFTDEARRNDIEEFTAELRTYGAQLFTELLPSDVQRLMWTHRDRLKQLRVVSTEPFIPWELVYVKEPGKPIDPDASRFLGEMGLVRWLHNVNGIPPTTLYARRSRCRYVIPDYPLGNWKLPDSLKERDYVEQKFGAVRVDPQPGPVRQLLTESGAFDLLHFACHGEADQDNITRARIVLEGRIEGPNYVPTYLEAGVVEHYGRLLGSDGSQPIVFLNACQAGRAGYSLTGIGGFARSFLSARAGAFVGTLWSVGDQPAFAFGRAFYEALWDGKNIAAATVIARQAARKSGDATWLAYVVYAHPHAKLKRAST